MKRMLASLMFILAPLGLIIATTAPAAALSKVRLFEAYGTFALGAPTLSSGQPVKETVSGRDVYAAYQYTDGNNHLVVKIEFVQDTSLCAAAVDGTQAVVVRGCGGNGTLWTQIDASCVVCEKFQNNRETSLNGQAMYLYGANNGTNLYWAISSANGLKVWQFQGP